MLSYTRKATHTASLQRYTEKACQNAEDSSQKGRAVSAGSLPLRGEPAEPEDEIPSDAGLARGAAGREDEVFDLRGDGAEEF